VGKKGFVVIGGICLVGFALLFAMALERVRASSRRAHLVARYDQMLRETNMPFLEAEAAIVASTIASEIRWISSLRLVDDALDHGRVDDAARAWQDAYQAALGTRQWESMADVGDASLRIAASSTAVAARAQARHSYLIALYRARAIGSVDGVLRVARAFDALGDRDASAACLQMAADLALQGRTADDVASVRSMTQPVGATQRR
jgi:hypothetical protein